MCQEEGINLQKGMNFRVKPTYSIILMSLREGAPYADRVEDDGNVLIYEGHDIPRDSSNPTLNPKAENQELYTPAGSLTENGKFYKSARTAKFSRKYEKVRVYEKIKAGIWVYNGIFDLVDAWEEQSSGRRVYKFKLVLIEDIDQSNLSVENCHEIEHSRLIPSEVKREVWKRDKGVCTQCGSKENLHFDHVIPFSKGGASITAKNIQLLCAKCNLRKRDKIQ